jgi:GDPmannose 4,6-dehydratase
VTQKIIQGVKAIVAGTQEKLRLGNLDIWRDWGWAPEYVEAMHLMLQTKQPRDYVIASGTSHSLGEFASAAFALGDLLAQERLEVASSLMRPSDLSYSAMDPSRIGRELNWRAIHGLEAIVAKMYREVLQ